MSKFYITNTPEETIHYASKFAEELQRGDIVALFGELGTGKTQFVKGICKKFKVNTIPTSPSFIILNRYIGKDEDMNEILLYHLDLYRIKSNVEVFDIGYEEFLGGNSIIVIEWANVLENLLPSKRYDVKLYYGNSETERKIEISKIE